MEQPKKNTWSSFLTLDNLKTMGQGALGAMTFGMYYMVVTNRKFDEWERERKLQMEEWEQERKLKMEELRKKLDT